MLKMKRFVALILCFMMVFPLISCESEEDKLFKAAQEPADRFMTAFCNLDLKEMMEVTDAQVDYSDLSFISLEDLKARMLVPFSIFEALGVPMDSFNEITDDIFDSYTNYASYKIVDNCLMHFKNSKS